VTPIYNDDDYYNDDDDMKFPIKPYIRIDESIEHSSRHNPIKSIKLESCNDVNWYYHYHISNVHHHHDSYY